MVFASRLRRDRRFRSVCATVRCAAEPGANAFAPPSDSRNAPKKVVIPFDFVSKWDHGVLGEKLGEMVWKKLSKDKIVVTTEAVQDIRDLCKSKNLQVTPDTPMEEVRDVIRKEFDAQVGIWGRIERAPGPTAKSTISR